MPEIHRDRIDAVVVGLQNGRTLLSLAVHLQEHTVPGAHDAPIDDLRTWMDWAGMPLGAQFYDEQLPVWRMVGSLETLVYAGVTNAEAAAQVLDFDPAAGLVGPVLLEDAAALARQRSCIEAAGVLCGEHLLLPDRRVTIFDEASPDDHAARAHWLNQRATA